MKSFVKKLALVGLIGLNTMTFASPSYQGNIGENRCYMERRLPISVDEAFEAMKDTFLKSNINLKSISKKDGYLFGEGFWKKGGNYYSLTISVTIKSLGEITDIKTIVSYSLTESEHATDTAGIAGVQFPISVPWKTELNVKENGNIKDPNFYIGFYKNFQKTLFDNALQPHKIILEEKPKEVEENNVTDKNNTTEKNSTNTTEEDIF